LRAIDATLENDLSIYYHGRHGLDAVLFRFCTKLTLRTSTLDDFATAARNGFFDELQRFVAQRTTRAENFDFSFKHDLFLGAVSYLTVQQHAVRILPVFLQTSLPFCFSQQHVVEVFPVRLQTYFGEAAKAIVPTTRAARTGSQRRNAVSW